MRAVAFVLLFLAYLPMTFVTPFIGVLLWMWISLMAPHTQIYGMLPFSYALVIAVVTVLAFMLSKERSLPPNTLTTWALVGMVVFATVAQFSAYDFDRSYSRWDTIWKGVFVSLLSLPLLTTRLRMHAYVWIFVLSVGYFGVKGGLFSFMTGGVHRVSAQGGNMLGDNNHLATGLVMTIPIVMYLAIHSVHRFMRVACWIYVFLLFVGSIFTYSRGGFLAMVGAMSVLWLRSSFKMVTTIALAFFAVVVVMFAPDALWQRFGSIDDFRDDGSAMGRLDIWRVALQLGFSHPLTGIGFHGTTLPFLVAQVDGSVQPRAIHNSYLEVFTEAGIFAFMCHLLLFFAMAIYLQQVRRLTRGLDEWKWAFDLASMLQVSIVGYAIGSFFLSLGFFDGWWFLVILGTALHLHVRSAFGRTVSVAGPRHPFRPEEPVLGTITR
jgi:putative inorganic carbon (HCO3(-)) transporter